MLESVAAARAFLAAAGLRKGDRCALLASNSAAWIAVDLAATAEGLIVVPLYARQAPAELVVMLRDAQPRLVCCGDAALRDGVRTAWAAAAPGPETPCMALFDEVLAGATDGKGVTAGAPPVALADSDPVTIIYTSGTSGEPKGVVLTAANVTYILSCTKQRLDRLMRRSPGPDHVFHYLPFCFASSWMVMLSCLSRQSVLRLATDLTRIADDLRAAEPDYCVNVPALLERMRTAIESQLASRGGIAHKIFRNAQAAWQRQSGGLSLAACAGPDISRDPQAPRRECKGAHQRFGAARRRYTAILHDAGHPRAAGLRPHGNNGNLHDGRSRSRRARHRRVRPSPASR